MTKNKEMMEAIAKRNAELDALHAEQEKTHDRYWWRLRHDTNPGKSDILVEKGLSGEALEDALFNEVNDGWFEGELRRAVRSWGNHPDAIEVYASEDGVDGVAVEIELG